MKVVCWNVNGIRACLGKGMANILDLKPDFLCLQETKAQPEQVPLMEYPHLARMRSVWASAEKKGYSGVATFSPHEGWDGRASMGIPQYDKEGRANLIYGNGFTLVNLYFPNGAASEERHNFKMGFLKDLIPWLKNLEKERGPLIICGDYNIAHQEIDIHDPIRNKDSSGFKPEERAWMTEFLANGFVDTFRTMNPHAKDEYSWWSFRQQSRERNKGWRIDYICVSKELEKRILSAQIHQDIYGSDHCPISLEIAIP